jgi:hypothetical protein
VVTKLHTLSRDLGWGCTERDMNKKALGTLLALFSFVAA